MALLDDSSLCGIQWEERLREWREKDKKKCRKEREREEERRAEPEWSAYTWTSLPLYLGWSVETVCSYTARIYFVTASCRRRTRFWQSIVLKKFLKVLEDVARSKENEFAKLSFLSSDREDFPEDSFRVEIFPRELIINFEVLFLPLSLSLSRGLDALASVQQLNVARLFSEALI